MEIESRYSGKRAVQGCSLSLAIIVASMLLLSLVLNKWLGLIYSNTQKNVELVIWLLAISLGGYFAARLGKNTGWTNSLVVGLLAAFFFLPTSGWNRISFDDGAGVPMAFWRSLAACLLSIPAAILGGVLWQRNAKTDDRSIDSSLDPSSKTDEPSDAREQRD